MSLQTLREQVTNLTRHRSLPASPPRSPKLVQRVHSSPKNLAPAGGPQLAPRDGDVLTPGEDEGDSSVEVLGPIKYALPRQNTKGSLDTTHPFFVKENWGPMPQWAPSVQSTTEQALPPRPAPITSRPKSHKGKAPSAPPVAPLYSYKNCTPRPTVVYITSENEANDILPTLKGPLGFDMEWCFKIRRGPGGYQDSKTALVQVADANLILLIQLSAMKRIPNKLKEIVESPTVYKLGANIKNDGNKLKKDYGVEPAGLVELGALALQVDPERTALLTAAEQAADAENPVKKPSKRVIVALAKLVLAYHGRVLDKGSARTSNWEQRLTAEQMEYAANDAYCALSVYNELVKLAHANKRTLSFENPTAPPPPAPAPLASTSASTSTSTATGLPPPSHQKMRAYYLWHQGGGSLDSIRAELRSVENPLAASTVISYVVDVLKYDPALPFDIERLKVLVKQSAYTRDRHDEWIASLQAAQTGEDAPTDR